MSTVFKYIYCNLVSFIYFYPDKILHADKFFVFNHFQWTSGPTPYLLDWS